MRIAGPSYLRDEAGACYYPFPDSAVKYWLVLRDGWSMIEQRVEYMREYSTSDLTWVVTPGPVDSIEFTVRPSRTHTGWRLTVPDAASAKFPAELTVEEWAERGWGDPDASEDAFMASRLYEKVIVEEPQPNEVLDTSSLTLLEGAPDQHPERHWRADQPASLVYSPGYHHLLRGTASGFRDHVTQALRAAGYDVFTYHDGNLEVTLRLPYAPPRWTTQQRVGRSGRKLRTTDRVQTMKQIKLRFRPVDLITAPSKAVAYEAFDRLAQEWVDWVASHNLAVCDHCGGEGAVHQSAARPTRTAR